MNALMGIHRNGSNQSLGFNYQITQLPIYRLMMRMFCQSYANFLPQSKHTM